jgi:predicted AlkP superfamily phosphohydrolase/phosphomutase
VEQKSGAQLLIGLDAMEWSLVKRWAREGKLPAFSRLIETGAHAELTSPAAELPDTVWPSVYTGTNPAKHERYYYFQYDARVQDLRRVPDDALRGIPFWTYLSQAGHRLAIVDVPKFPLSRILNGAQLANWGAHATHTRRSSHPDSLLADIRSRFGDFPVQECDAVDTTPRALVRLRQQVLEGVRLHGRVFRWLMQHMEWHEFFAVFSAPHCIGHHCWHGLDVSHPRHDEARQHGFSNAIEEVYRAIDHEIGEMLKMVGLETRVMVFAAHGMGPLCHGSWNLQQILDLLGHGHPAGRGVPTRARWEGTRNFLRTLRVAMPGAMQFKVADLLPRAIHDELLFRLNAGRRRWEGCRAFAVPNNDSVGAIRINVKGRDKNGIVEPGEEYRQLCKQIAADLQELTDPVSGNPIVSRITMTQKQFHGPFLDGLPDLTVLWNQSFRWSSVHSSSLGSLTIPVQDRRTGSHRPDGFLLVAGPGVPAGAQLTGCSVYDIAPTVLTMAGIPIPNHMDGRPLPI